MSDQIKQAIAHIKSGNKKAGKAILMRLLEENPANSNAWLAMSAVVNSVKKRRECLQEAIQHDPNNQTAHRALAKLNEKYPPPEVVETAVVLEDENEDEEAWLPESFKSPPSPAPAQPTVTKKAPPKKPQQENHLESTIIRGLATYRQPKEIAKDLAEKGVDYTQALKLIYYLSKTKKRQIALRRMPIVLLIVIPTFLFGIVFLFSSRLFIYGIALVSSSIVGLVTTLKDILAKN